MCFHEAGRPLVIGCSAPSPKRSTLNSNCAPWFPPEPSALIDGHEIREAGWIYHAAEADLPDDWPEAIFLAKRGCPLSFTYETPSAMALDARVAAHMAAVRAATAFHGTL